MHREFKVFFDLFSVFLILSPAFPTTTALKLRNANALCTIVSSKNFSSGLLSGTVPFWRLLLSYDVGEVKGLWQQIGGKFTHAHRVCFLLFFSYCQRSQKIAAIQGLKYFNPIYYAYFFRIALLMAIWVY